MQNNQKLGLKVFYYYLSKNILAGIILFIISMLIASLKVAAISKLTYIMKVGTATVIMGYLITGLFIVSTLVLIIGALISWVKYISCTFTIGENSLSIKRGIVSKKEVSIPFRQIQDVSIEQSFSKRMMGISKLVILTAGNDSNDKEGEAEGVFEMIDAKLAQQIRDDLLQKSNNQNQNISKKDIDNTQDNFTI